MPKMKRPPMKKIAEESGFSRRTLYRVLHNDPTVKPETREALTRALNIHGICVETHDRPEKVVVDVSAGGVFTPDLAARVIERLNLENYHTVRTVSDQE